MRTGIIQKAGYGTREASALLVRKVGEAHACVDVASMQAAPLMIRRSSPVCFRRDADVLTSIRS